ncbi:MAG: tetratricopeptide repeat protein [Desulfosarcinaceae bacterium]
MLIACLLFLSCASGPAPQRQPRAERDQTRYLNNGVVMYTMGCYARAMENFNEAHERYALVDDLEGEANSLNGIANTYYRLGDIHSALLVYDDALDLYTILNQREGLTRTMVDKAAALIEADRLDEASAMLDRADAQAGGEMAAQRFRARALVALARKEFSSARGLLEKALAAAQGSASSVVSSIYFAQGHLALVSETPREALKPLHTALDMDRRAGAHADIAKDLEALAQCQRKLGKDHQALAYLVRSVKIHALLGDARRVGTIVPEMEQLSAKTGIDIHATLHWVNQWLSGKSESHLCR